MKRVALSLLLPCAVVLAQAQANPFLEQQKQLLAQAKEAFDREMAREKVGDCRDSTTTYDNVMCLEKAGDATDANYKAYAGALRAMLALKNPNDSGPAPDFSGPTGRPATQQETLSRFDAMQAAWDKYRTAMCLIVDGQYRGGTIVNIEVGNCYLKMVRNHMRELAAVFGDS